MPRSLIDPDVPRQFSKESQPKLLPTLEPSVSTNVLSPYHTIRSYRTSDTYHYSTYSLYPPIARLVPSLQSDYVHPFARIDHRRDGMSSDTHSTSSSTVDGVKARKRRRSSTPRALDEPRASFDVASPTGQEQAHDLHKRTRSDVQSSGDIPPFSAFQHAITPEPDSIDIDISSDTDQPQDDDLPVASRPPELERALKPSAKDAFLGDTSIEKQGFLAYKGTSPRPSDDQDAANLTRMETDAPATVAPALTQIATPATKRRKNKPGEAAGSKRGRAEKARSVSSSASSVQRKAFSQKSRSKISTSTCEECQATLASHFRPVVSDFCGKKSKSISSMPRVEVCNRCYCRIASQREDYIPWRMQMLLRQIELFARAGVEVFEVTWQHKMTLRDTASALRFVRDLRDDVVEELRQEAFRRPPPPDPPISTKSGSTQPQNQRRASLPAAPPLPSYLQNLDPTMTAYFRFVMGDEPVLSPVHHANMLAGNHAMEKYRQKKEQGKAEADVLCKVGAPRPTAVDSAVEPKKRVEHSPETVSRNDDVREVQKVVCLADIVPLLLRVRPVPGKLADQDPSVDRGDSSAPRPQILAPDAVNDVIKTVISRARGKPAPRTALRIASGESALSSTSGGSSTSEEVNTGGGPYLTPDAATTLASLELRLAIRARPRGRPPCTTTSWTPN
ncbi:hypothetical protein PYCC9005_002523 [Savitreella phatthalungensis]